MRIINLIISRNFTQLRTKFSQYSNRRRVKTVMRIEILTRLIITYPSLIYCFHSEGVSPSRQKPTYCTHIVHEMVNFLEL